jgi:hypothetical protein
MTYGPKQMQQARIDEAYRLLVSQILAAWLMQAPGHPDEACTVAIPMPEGLILKDDVYGLSVALEALPIVQRAECVDEIDPRLPIPGLVAECRPYAAVTSPVGAA